MNYNFQADDEGSTPFIHSSKAHQNDGLFFMPKCLCYKDLERKENMIYIWMCPTLLGQAHKRNGIFGEFGIEFDKKFDNGFDKPIWEKMPACGYSM